MAVGSGDRERWNRVQRRSRNEGETEYPGMRAIGFAGGDLGFSWVLDRNGRTNLRAIVPSCKSPAEGATGGLLL